MFDWKKIDQLAPICAAMLLFLFCVIRVPTNDLRGAFELFFKTAVLLLLFVILWKANKWVALFYLLSWFSAELYIVNEVSQKAFEFILYGVLWYFSIVMLVPMNKVHYLLNVICCIALVNVLSQFGQYCRFDFLHEIREGDPRFFNPLVGLMDNRNNLSSLLAICFPAFLRVWRVERFKIPRTTWKFSIPIGWFWGIPVVLIGLYHAQSWNGIIGVLIGLTAYWYIKWRVIAKAIKTKWVVFVLPVICLFWSLYCLRFLGRGSDIAGRLTAWKNALPYYLDHWLFGWGLGHWKVQFREVELIETLNDNVFWWWSKAHNEPYQILCELGAFFGVIYILYLFTTIKRVLKKLSNNVVVVSSIAVLIIVAVSHANFIFHIGTPAMVAITWMAVLEIGLWEKPNTLPRSELKAQN